MTPTILKRAQILTSDITLLEAQLASIKSAMKVEGMGVDYISFEIPTPKGATGFDNHYEHIQLSALPAKAQRELFADIAVKAKSKLQYRLRVARKELNSL